MTANRPGFIIGRLARRLACAVALQVWLAASTWAQDPQLLVRLDPKIPVTELGLPVHAYLRDHLDREYVLVFATEPVLGLLDQSYVVLGADAVPRDYVIATPMRPGAAAQAAEKYPTLYDDGVQLVVRAPGQEDVEALLDMGFEIQRIRDEPLVWPSTTSGGEKTSSRSLMTESGSPDPLVAEMISQVMTAHLSTWIGRFSGVEAALAGGTPYAGLTRHTASGASVLNATQAAYDCLQAIGLDVQFHDWSGSGYSGRNVIGTLPGGVLSNEIVVVVAHLDDMPSSGAAPGADDNASGSVAVLTLAGILRQFSFEKTIRFILVTGEEQGKLGSSQYATEAQARGDDIRAVFNMDMLGWDSIDGPVFRLHTRPVGNPGYTGDLAIASVFTNVVDLYGMGGSLSPAITNSGITSSDHSAFWNSGYPAILAIEDYPADVTPYYHTANDTLASLNMTYYTAAVKACVATVAHLASPTGRTPVDVLEVAAGDWTPGSGIGVGACYVQHEAGATEDWLDGHDRNWSSAPPNPNVKWLKIFTAPYGDDLRVDCRATDSETVFAGQLLAMVTNGTDVSCTNRLRFSFLTSPTSNRVYMVRVHVDGQYTAGSNAFDCVTNLRDVVAAGGYIDLPSLSTVSNGVVYGTCDIGTSHLNTETSGCRVVGLSMVGGQFVLNVQAQSGTRIADDVEINTNLLVAGGWVPFGSFTNTVIPSVSDFTNAWTEATRSLDTSSLTNAPGYYFRFNRRWLGW